jgi:hypothetical protein
MIEAAAEFRRGNYQHVLIVRGVLDPNHDYDLSWSSAEYGAAALAKNGVPGERIAKVFTETARKDRTYHAALGVRQWFRTNNISVTGINIATLGPHARRSGLLYRKAFAPEVPVGTIALSPRSYDERRWWRYSEGVREVIGETIAFIYARFLFTAD